MISGVYMLDIKKHARWIQRLVVSVTDHKCGIGISSILDTVFRYLPLFRTALRYWQPRPQGFSLKKWVEKALGTRLRYWVSPNVPLLERLAIALR